MMAKLYKATEKGQIEMTPEEEKEVRDLWAKEEGKPLPQVRLSLEDRLAALETKVEKLASKEERLEVKELGV